MSQVAKPKFREFVQKDFHRINNDVMAEEKKGEKESISIRS